VKFTYSWNLERNIISKHESGGGGGDDDDDDNNNNNNNKPADVYDVCITVTMS
jgi:hypothetical protein